MIFYFHFHTAIMVTVKFVRNLYFVIQYSGFKILSLQIQLPVRDNNER